MTGYEKLPLKEVALEPSVEELTRRSLAELGPVERDRWDRYLLRYRVGTFVLPHVDPPLEPGWMHVQLNLVVQHAKNGGRLYLDGVEVPLEVGDAVVFRPDVSRHEVTPIEAGERLIWSVGCNLRESGSGPERQRAKL
jgi:hypothetical protein